MTAKQPYARSAENVMVEALELHLVKSADYGDTGDRLGSMGTFADVWRKVGKLKRAMWDGQTLTGEQPREILLDLIGHSIKAIIQLDEEGSAQ